LIIRPVEQQDLQAIARVHQQAFVRQKESYQWLECSFNASPRFMLFTAEDSSGLVGYIIWSQKSGFRPEVVLELEQIAVLPDKHGQGIGQALILQSLPFVRQQLAQREAVLKHIIVTTRADNQAQHLYRKTLGAEVESTISDLYSADEVIMIARHISDQGSAPCSDHTLSGSYSV